MKEFLIGRNDAGQRLDRWLAKAVPLLPAPLAQKYIRLKRVKVNGRGSRRDVRLEEGDVLQLYINDEFFDRPTPENAFLSLYQPKLDILYDGVAKKAQPDYVFTWPGAGEFWCTLGEVVDGRLVPMHRDDFCMK